MNQSKWPPHDNGTRVQVSKLLNGSGYTAEAIRDRVPGAMGRIISHSDSHGLCYQIRHDDGTCAYYDPDELQYEGTDRFLNDVLIAKEIIEK